MAAETEVERLVVRLIGDGSKYQKMLAEASIATKKAEQTLREIHPVTKSVETATERYGRTYKELGRLVKSGEISLKTYGRALQKLRGDYRQTTREAMIYQMTASKISRTAGLVSANFLAMGRNLRFAGMMMSMALTAPLLAIGTMAVRAFSSFDKAMTESIAIMQVTDQQIDQMRKTALELSGSGNLLQTPTELAKSYFYLASAGKNAEQSMALLPKVANFATAGAFDMALATDLLTDAQSALGMSTKNVAQDTANLVKVSDTLVKANTLANASVQQFSTALTSKAGAAMKSYNIELADGMSLLAGYADQGIKAELAGNAYARVVRLLTKSVADNADVFERLGIAVFDSRGEFRKAYSWLKDLEDALKGIATEERAAILTTLGFEARIQDVILPLLGASQGVKSYYEKLLDVNNVTDSVAAKMKKAFGNQMTAFKNQIGVLALEIGEKLIPYIVSVVKYLKTWVDWWEALSEKSKDQIVLLGLIVASIGPLLLLISTLSFAYAKLTGVLSLVTAAYAAVTTGAITAGAAMTVATLGVSALVVGLVMLSKYLSTITVEMEEYNDALRESNRMQGKIVERTYQKGEKIKQDIEKETDPILKREKLTKAVAQAETEVKGLEQLMLPIAKGNLEAQDTWSNYIFEPAAIEEAKRQVAEVKDQIGKAKTQADEFRQMLADMGGVDQDDLARTILEDQERGKAVEDLTATYQRQIATYGKTAREIDVYDLSLKGVGKTQMREIELLQEKLNKLDEVAELEKKVAAEAEKIKAEQQRDLEKQMARAKQITEKYMPKEKQRAAQRAELKVLLEMEEGGITQETFDLANKALDEIQEKAKIKISFSTIDAAGAGTAEAMSRLNEFQSLRGVKSKRLPDELRGLPNELQRPSMVKMGPPPKAPKISSLGLPKNFFPNPEFSQKVWDKRSQGTMGAPTLNIGEQREADRITGQLEKNDTARRMAAAVEILVEQGKTAAETRTEEEQKAYVIGLLNAD